jgi:hypothetical protein
MMDINLAGKTNFRNGWSVWDLKNIGIILGTISVLRKKISFKELHSYTSTQKKCKSVKVKHQYTLFL